MARKRYHTRHTSRSNPRGRIELHKGGYGFVQTSEGEFFIPRSKTGGAFPDDMVEIAPIKHYGSGQRSNKAKQGATNLRRTARVVAVRQRAQEDIIGYLRHGDPFGIVVPADLRIQHDIVVPLDQVQGIKDGSIVRVRITTFPDRHTIAMGTIEEVLGDDQDEHIAIDLIVSRAKFETVFSKASLRQAQEAHVDVETALQTGVVDMRDRCVFTIDPDDAKDFDDAVSLDKAILPDKSLGWCLGVYIADVSHYVEWESSIDLDARRRATSVYLADRVIPMLPEELSNDICSLRPDEDRRVIAVDIMVRQTGEVIAALPRQAVIRSSRRLTYEQAQRIIDEHRSDPCTSDFDSADLDTRINARICALSQLAQRFKRLHARKGALDFDTVEAKVELDVAGHPLAIDLREKTEATELIEEAMVTANEAIACYLRDRKFPCMYRVHEAPAADTLEGLSLVLEEFDWFKTIDKKAFIAGVPSAVQEALAQATGRPEEELVSSLILRSMKRALYSPECSDHYGLASEAYCHFTSPIRRYPDLVVHRLLKAALFGRSEKFDQEVKALPWLAQHSSEMERLAEKASYESQEVKIIELMEEHIGETFEGMISGVTTFGLFVRLDNTAEGLIDMTDLGHEYFMLDAVRHTLTGSDTGKQFRLGQRMKVKLVEADARLRHLRLRPIC